MKEDQSQEAEGFIVFADSQPGNVALKLEKPRSILAFLNLVSEPGLHLVAPPKTILPLLTTEWMDTMFLDINIRLGAVRFLKDHINIEMQDFALLNAKYGFLTLEELQDKLAAHIKNPEDHPFLEEVPDESSGSDYRQGREEELLEEHDSTASEEDSSQQDDDKSESNSSWSR